MLVQTTILDDDSEEVKQVIFKTYDGSHGWEIESLFRKLGERVAKIIDPSHE